MSKVRRVDFYADEFLVGTSNLTAEEKGAYWVICALIYSQGGPVPDDGRWLAKVCGLSTRRWTCVRDRLLDLGKLRLVDDQLTNGRCEKELASARKRTDQATANGQNGGRPKGGSSGRVSGENCESLAEKIGLPAPNGSETSAKLNGESGASSPENNDLAKPGGSDDEKLTTNQQPPTNNQKRALPRPPLAAVAMLSRGR